MEARLNITWNGQCGDLPDPIEYDTSEPDIKAMAMEAVRNGSVPGIRADNSVDFSDFRVEKFPAEEGRDFMMVMIRPKTPYGR